MEKIEQRQPAKIRAVCGAAAAEPVEAFCRACGVRFDRLSPRERSTRSPLYTREIGKVAHTTARLNLKIYERAQRDILEGKSVQLTDLVAKRDPFAPTMFAIQKGLRYGSLEFYRLIDPIQSARGLCESIRALQCVGGKEEMIYDLNRHVELLLDEIENFS